MKKVGVACLRGGARYLIPFLKECIQVQPTSFGTTLMVKDDDVEVQGAGQSQILPQNGRGQGFWTKDPLIWELPILAQHCDEKVKTMAKQIVGKFTQLFYTF